MSATSKSSSIAKSAMSLSLVSTITLVFSFLKESVFACFFGTTATADAYAIAIQLPVTLFAVVSTAISTVVIPNYSKVLIQNGSGEARKFASNLMTVVTFITLLLLLILELGAPLVIKLTAPGLVEETSDLTCLLFRMIMPTVLLTQLININTGILNVHKSFMLPALGSMFLNIVYVFFVVLLANSCGIYAAVIGVIVGSIGQFLYSMFLRRRFVKYRYEFNLKDDAMVDSVKMSFPVFIGIGAAEINRLVDKMVSSFLQPGSIASLNYASKLSSAASSLLLSGISTVVYPEFSRCVNEKRFKDLANHFLLSLKLYVLITFPLIVGGAFLSNEIIAVIFKRGLFDTESVARTAPIFACYLAGLLFTAIRQSSSRLFYSYRDSKTPMKNSIIGIVCNIVLNIILVQFLQALGLALATVLSAAIISTLILKDAKKINEHIEYGRMLPFVAKVFCSSVIMIGFLYIFKSLIGFKLLVSENIFYQIFYLLLSTLIGVLGYGVMLFVTKTDEAQIVLRKIMKRKKA